MEKLKKISQQFSKNFNDPFISNIRLITASFLLHRQISRNNNKKKNFKNILLNFIVLQPCSIRCSTSAVTSNGNRFECQIISIRVLDSWQGRQEERREYGVGGAYRRSDRVKVCSVARYAHKSGYIWKAMQRSGSRQVDPPRCHTPAC